LMSEITCPTNCAVCLDIEGKSICKECIEPFKLEREDNTCKETCNSGRFADDDRECQDCDKHCLECNGPDADDCIKCVSTKDLRPNGTCQKNCGDGYYGDDNNVCKKCSNECKTCYGPNRNECESCPGSKKLNIDGTCQDKCGSGSFETSDAKCVKCHITCADCTGQESNQCTTCSKMTVTSAASTALTSVEGTFTTKIDSQTGTCGCPDGFYLENGINCVLCSIGYSCPNRVDKIQCTANS